MSKPAVTKERAIRVKVEDVSRPARTIKVPISRCEIKIDAPAYVVKKSGKQSR